MRLQHTSATGRRARGAVAAALGLLLVAAAALVPTASASAMQQIDGTPPPTGVPGGSVTATIQNQQGGTGNWTITAPPHTTITAARTQAGTGLNPFTCQPAADGRSAACGNILWGSPNTVDITMTIDADAPLGTFAGSSGIAPFEAAAPYSITVVPPAAPAAPAITAPPAGDESIVTQPTITGTKTAGAAGTTGTTLTATIDGEPLCTVEPSTDTTWSCTPSQPLEVGPHTISATQTDRFDQTSTAATSTFTVLAEAGLTITQTGGEPLYAGLPVVHTVTVANTGDGEARGAVVTADTTGLQASACELDGAELDCGSLADGVDVDTIAPDAARVIRLTVAAPPGTPPGTSFTIAVRATSTTAAVSPVDSSGTLTTVAPPAPVITTPANGSSTTDRRVGVSGRGVLPGSTVAVRQGGTVLCTTTGAAASGFSCTPDRSFPLGSVTLTATQTFGGVESAVGSTRFTVRAPATTPPGGTTPAPGTGGGSAGGPGGAGGVGTGGGNASGGNGSGSGSGQQPVAPAPVVPAPAAPANPSPATPAPGSGGAGSGGGSGDGGATNDGPLTMDLRFGTQRILPGTAADMRGTLGPNASGATVAITFQARISTGMVYRDVAVAVDDQPLDCTVATTSFSCMIPLDPGQRADVDVRVYADPVNAPDTAVQQITLASTRASQGNAMTVTTAVAKGETEAALLADQITTFNVTEFPGAMVPLLAMLLFALAATVAGRRNGGGPAAQATTSPTGAGPPGPSRASSPITEPPSGSNR